MAKLSSKKWKKSSFYKENSLVGLTPGSSRIIALSNIPAN